MFLRIRPLTAAPRSRQQLQHLVRGLRSRPYQLLGVTEIAEVSDPDATAPVFVLIGRPDATPRRADLFLSLAGAVEELVIRQRQVGAVGNVQLLLRADAAC